MIKRSFFVAVSGVALFAAAPASAQASDEAEPTELDGAQTVESEALDQEAADEIGAMLGDLFGEAEPLTLEQEDALPMAQQVVAQVFPEGTYAKMMNDTIKPMMDGMSSSFMDVPLNQIARLTGLFGPDLPDMGEGTLKEVMAILDPAFEERSQIVSKVTIETITDLMTEIEPSYREGLSRAYAVRFTPEELADLKAYFETPVGAKYASESMLIYTDPQVMSTMNEMMPAMMSMLPKMTERIAAEMENLPPERRFSDLSSEEKAKLSELLGVTPEMLQDAEPILEEEFEAIDDEPDPANEVALSA